jgi:Zn-dependent protease
MVGTALLSLGGYTLLFGAIFGALLMAVLLIHELGHFAEARRHGLSVRLPFFIPFIGAAVTMRNMPGDAATHARIALAGPLCGTLAVAVACMVAAPTNAQGIILFAQLGALINLLNLAPMSILDGGTILASLSRWIAVGGLLMAALLVVGVALSNQFSPLVLVIAGLAVYSVINRFRRHRTPYYRSVSRRARFVLGSVWFAVGGYLIVAGGATAVATLTW